VALLLFLVLIAVTPLLQQPLRTAWDNKIPVDWKTVVTHFLLVHNLHADWIYKIDGPMWSVATEWQIYFFFPLLLFIWRKTNLLYAVLAGLFIGAAAGFKLAILHPWYLGLFALGMAAAILSFSPDEFFVQWRNKINWRVQVRIWMPLLVVFLLLSWYRHIPAIVCETFVGFVMCIVIVHYTLVDVRNDKADAFLQLLKSTPVVTLGVFSYSIYLVHSPIIALVNLLALDAPMSYGFRMLFMLLLAAPLAIACAYLFYVLVEKRFLSTHARKEARVLNIQ
jgi:peptidoglycan/LPS O-acetylase OafA/YrhL